MATDKVNEVWIAIDPSNLKVLTETTWDGGTTQWDGGATQWDLHLATNNAWTVQNFPES